MKAADWDVEDALSQVIGAIGTGAGTFTVEPSTETGLKDGYRDDFEERKAAGIEWSKASREILPLALVVGATAAMLTSVKAAMNGSPLPEALDEKLTYTAAWLVAQSSPECIRPGFLGGFCRSFPAPDSLSKVDRKTLSRASEILGPAGGLGPSGPGEDHEA